MKGWCTCRAQEIGISGICLGRDKFISEALSLCGALKAFLWLFHFLLILSLAPSLLSLLVPQSIHLLQAYPCVWPTAGSTLSCIHKIFCFDLPSWCLTRKRTKFSHSLQASPSPLPRNCCAFKKLVHCHLSDCLADLHPQLLFSRTGLSF